MPPQQPSASWRAMIHSAQRRSAARRARSGIRCSTLCSALSRPLKNSDQGSRWPAFGGRPGDLRVQLVDLERQRPGGLEGRDHGEGHDRLPRPAAPVVDVQREPGRQVDDLRRDHRQVVPGPQARQRQPDAGEHAGGRHAALVDDPVGGQLHVRRVGGVARPAAAPRTPRPWWTGRQARRRSWPRCRRPAAACGSSPPPRPSCSAVRMPRKWRSSRSSASMVTLVSSSPCHHPSGCCSAEQVVAGPLGRRRRRGRLSSVRVTVYPALTTAAR